MKYTPMFDLQQIKRISIRAYLQRCGITPQRENEYYGFYLSPIREESTPSFKVDYQQNLWYDFGIDTGGSIVDLVMRMEHCDFVTAVRILDNNELVVVAPNKPIAITSPLSIVDVRPLQSADLIDYLHLRRVDFDVAKCYCREVHYSVHDRHYHTIGFKNNAGGWELRSEYFKGSSTPKNVTTIDNSNNCCLVFEGFMDFLSYLTLNLPATFCADVIVLNSVANLNKAVTFVRHHTVVKTFLDNDDAGRRTTSEIICLCPNSEIIDCSTLYSPCKDVNQYLQQHSKQMQIQPKKQGMKL